MLLGMLAVGCSATTVALVPTPKGTYRFYTKPFQPDTFVELCTIDGPTITCKDVKISISIL